MLETILLVRHGVSLSPWREHHIFSVVLTSSSQFRPLITCDPKTNVYNSSVPSPTNIGADPPLTAHGAKQSHELAEHLVSRVPQVDQYYSSPFYRCIQTVEPSVRKNQLKDTASESFQHIVRRDLNIRLHPGLGEWYARDECSDRSTPPTHASVSLLASLLPNLIDETYEPRHKPQVEYGETVEELHRRVGQVLQEIIRDSDEAGTQTICICTHAATLIAMHRTLTGRLSQDLNIWCQGDPKAWTCGVWGLRRHHLLQSDARGNPSKLHSSWNAISEDDGHCSYLSQGQQRGW